MVIFSFPKIISSATRPPIATSSLARSWDFDQLSSSFSGNWATFKRKFVYIQRVLQFGFSSAVFHAQISVSVKHIRSTKSLTAWERDETWWLRERWNYYHVTVLGVLTIPKADPRGTMVALWIGKAPGVYKATSACPPSWYATNSLFLASITALLRSGPLTSKQ